MPPTFLMDKERGTYRGKPQILLGSSSSRIRPQEKGGHRPSSPESPWVGVGGQGQDSGEESSSPGPGCWPRLVFFTTCSPVPVGGAVQEEGEGQREGGQAGLCEEEG